MRFALIVLAGSTDDALAACPGACPRTPVVRATYGHQSYNNDPPLKLPQWMEIRGNPLDLRDLIERSTTTAGQALFSANSPMLAVKTFTGYAQ